MGRIAAEHDIEPVELEALFQGKNTGESLFAELLPIGEPLALARLGEEPLNVLLEPIDTPGWVRQVPGRGLLRGS